MDRRAGQSCKRVAQADAPALADRAAARRRRAPLRLSCQGREPILRQSGSRRSRPRRRRSPCARRASWEFDRCAARDRRTGGRRSLARATRSARGRRCELEAVDLAADLLEPRSHAPCRPARNGSSWRACEKLLERGRARDAAIDALAEFVDALAQLVEALGSGPGDDVVELARQLFKAIVEGLQAPARLGQNDGAYGLDLSAQIRRRRVARALKRRLVA